jgi:dihydroxyacetone kinase DhaKLM complex PTS-EIIA-like component DhaM
MERTRTTAGAVVAAVLVVSGLLAGCAQSSVETDPEPGSGSAGPSRTESSSSVPSSSSARSSSSASPAVFPPGQPPRPGEQSPLPWTDTVPGLTEAVRAAAHPGLQICGDDVSSTVISASDLRGIGTTQWLVDSTCDGATATSPDEVSIYEDTGSGITRTDVVYEFTANRPRLTASPYLFGPHTVVLTFDEGASYRLVAIQSHAVVPGLVSKFS